MPVLVYEGHYFSKFLCVRCVLRPCFGLRSVLFVLVLVCEVCYFSKSWSARNVIPTRFGL